MCAQARNLASPGALCRQPWRTRSPCWWTSACHLTAPATSPAAASPAAFPPSSLGQTHVRAGLSLGPYSRTNQVPPCSSSSGSCRAAAGLPGGSRCCAGAWTRTRWPRRTCACARTSWVRPSSLEIGSLLRVHTITRPNTSTPKGWPCQQFKDSKRRLHHTGTFPVTNAEGTASDSFCIRRVQGCSRRAAAGRGACGSSSSTWRPRSWALRLIRRAPHRAHAAAVRWLLLRTASTRSSARPSAGAYRVLTIASGSFSHPSTVRLYWIYRGSQALLSVLC